MDEIVMKHKDDDETRSTITVPKKDRALWEKHGYVLAGKTDTPAPAPAQEEE